MEYYLQKKTMEKCPNKMHVTYAHKKNQINDFRL